MIPDRNKIERKPPFFFKAALQVETETHRALMGLTYPTQRCWRKIDALGFDIPGHSCVFIAGFDYAEAVDQGLITADEPAGEGSEGSEGEEDAK